MNALLNLNIDKETIEKAKLVEKKNGVSLSKLIEQYLILLVSKKAKANRASSISEKLSGIIEEPKTSYKIEKAKYLLAKHA